jgi:energy-coupling factor transport system ATP-binding protein
VLTAGLDTTDHDVGGLAAHVGYVFQNPDHQLFSPSVRAELAFGPRTLGVSEQEIERRVAETLAAFGLQDLADTPPALLGFAQRRLVAVAAVAASRPRLLVLDEPFAGLSWPSAARLGALIEELAQAGHAVVMITHQMRAVAEFATRCVVLDGGRVLADGPVHAILTDPDLLTRAALAPPTTWQLGDRLREFGFGGRAVRVDELVREYQRVRGAVP